MRKQYHFRPSPDGLRAWDVNRLIALSNSLPRMHVALSSVREIDEAYWSSGYDRPLTCREIVEHMQLMQQCDFTFPIILCSEGRVMDGMHRICKALLLGRHEIEAVRFVNTPEPDYTGQMPEDLPY